MHLHLLPTVDVPLQLYSFLWDQGESGFVASSTGCPSWGCISMGNKIMAALPAELWLQWVWMLHRFCCRDVRAKVDSEEVSSSGSSWGDLRSHSWSSWLPRPSAGEYPKLTLPWLSPSMAFIVWISQPVLCPSHCPILFFLIFSCLFFFFIVMEFSEQLLTLELLSDSSVFFSCRLHLCIVLLNCWMNVAEPSVTESLPAYCISFGRTAVETL